MRLKAIGWLAGAALLLTSTGCALMSSQSAPPALTPTPEDTPIPPSELPLTAPPPTATPEPQLAARVNGEPITLADYERELERYMASLAAQGIDPSSEEGQEKLNQARVQILDVMVEQVLIEQAAEEAGVVVTDAEVDQYVQDMAAEAGGEEALRSKLEAWGETMEGARREIRAQLIGMAMTERIVSELPESAEQVHARHVLVDTADEARRIHAQLEAGAEFAALAKAHSQDTSTRDHGGDLGYFPRGILMASAVEEAAFSLQPGQFSDVIPSALGYHIVQVVERDPDRPISPENQQLLREQAVQDWIADLWAEAEVERLVEASP
ncbi:MAG: peptidylprolyl isomerase [Chloroflexota bacterium]|nr:peptidylprolyl isomerase [Chloroflexota bacterium]